MRVRVVRLGLVLVVLASAAAADGVVLIGVDPGDPYHAAATKIARHWRTDAILRFDPERIRQWVEEQAREPNTPGIRGKDSRVDILPSH